MNTSWAPDFIMWQRAGATGVIQPRGSIRCYAVIDAANERGVAMVSTGMRHLRE